MPDQVYRVSEVFGINRDLPLNYQERESADQILVNSLTREQHIVIYGSSKQGKTCLRKHCLKSEDYVVVHCSNKWELHDLHTAILKKVGYEVTLSDTKSSTGKNKVVASIKADFLGVGGTEVGTELESETGDTTTKAPLELEPEDVNDIISALEACEFERFIVLEDFHYLPIETQRDFSVALKAFHENSKICFLVVGVWLEENRLTVYNGDLTGRVLAIDADMWTEDELQRVMSDGEVLLNVSFDDSFKDALLTFCHASVHIVQESCYRCCISEGVNETLSDRRTVGKDINAKAIIREIVSEQTGRFNSFITQFSDGFQSTELEMHRWLLYPILTLPIHELEAGIRQRDIRETLQEHHPKGSGLNPGNLTQALQSVAALQIKKNIKPTILDYDQTNLRLRVVDRSFLIWRENQNVEDLIELSGLPLSE